MFERAGQKIGANPTEQLKIARRFQEQKDYSNAVAAYRRLLKRWPTAEAVQDAQFGLAECLEELQYYFKAFKQYQELIDKHPNTGKFETVLQRQYDIGLKFMNGAREKAWGVKWFPARDKAIDIFEQVVKNGPYSKVGPEAQYHVGLTYESLKEYLLAVKAYEKVLERYPNHPLAETAQFEIGEAYRKEAGRSEYDQNAANQAIAAYADFLVRYPHSTQVAQAEQYQAALKQEQAKGLFRIGQYYEKNKQYKAALIYYNDVIEQNPKSDWAAAAKVKVAALSPKTATATATP